MAEALQYIVDENGKKTSVRVPLKVWNQLNDDYQKLQNKPAGFSGIREGLGEVEAAKQNGKELQMLKDFLA